MFSKSHTSHRQFHVQKLALEALQEIRIKHRWEAMDFENQLILQSKLENKHIFPSFYLTEIL